MAKFKTKNFEEMQEHYPEFDINLSRNRNSIKQLYNQKFKHLTALYPTHHNKQLCWVCRCDCGTYTVYSTDKLISGEATTCGPSCPYKKSKLHDLTGQTFGRLTVIQRCGVTNDGHALWECKCECGNITKVNGRYLEHGQINSCGKCPTWSTHSKGETAIANWLTQHSIVFEREKRFKDCNRGSAPFRFDFFLPQQNLLIEYQGIQHFYPTGGWFNSETVRDCQEKDQIKANYALNNGYQLLIITYCDNVAEKLEDALC